MKKHKNLPRSFPKTLKAGDVLCMYGDLGVGKTAFVQGLAKGLGIDELSQVRLLRL